MTRLTNLVTQSTAISSLTECQSILVSLIESIEDAVFVKDLHGCYVLVNKRAAAILNKPAAEIIGHTAAELMADLYSADYVAEVLAEDRQLLASGVPLTVERAVFVHGVWCYYQAIKSVWRDAQGQPLGIISIDRDITERQAAKNVRTMPVRDEAPLIHYDDGASVDSTERSSVETTLQRYTDMLHLSYDAILVWSLKGGIEFWNRGAESLYGYTAQEAIGQMSHHLLASTHPLPFPAMLADLRQKGMWEGEIRHITKAGKPVIVSTRHQRMEDGADDLVVLEINRDITAQKQAEAARRESEERFATFFRHSPYPIAILSLATQRYVDVNPTWVRNTGYTYAEAIGRTPAELHLQAEPRLHLLSRLRQEGTVHDVEIRSQVRDGTVHTALMSAKLIQINDEPHALLVYADITERKQAEAALQASESQLRLVTDNVSGLISYVDHEQCYRFVNAVYEQWFMQSRTQIIGRTVYEILGASAYAAAQSHIHAVLAGARVTFENTITYPDTVTRTVLTTYVPDVGAEGQTLGFYALITDISERKQAEERLRFLAETSTMLASSLDYTLTLQNVAHAAVPNIADWCVIDLRGDDGSLQTAVIAHKEPAKVQWAEELRQRTPIDMDAPRGVPNVMRTGQPEFYPEITDAMLQAVAKNAEELALLRSAGYRSVMIVPLQTHGRILGAITFVATDSTRYFTPADLTMAEELAQRAAAAIGNAQLHRAVQQREQQLRISEEEIQRLNRDLKRRLDELQSLLDVAPIGIFVAHDPACTIITSNAIGAKMLGMEQAKNASKSGPTAAALPFRVLRDGRELAPEELPMQYAAAQDVAVNHWEVDVVQADGTVVNLYEYALPLHDEEGKVRGCLGIFVDITERKQAEAAMRASEERFRSAFEQAAVGMAHVDLDGHYLRVNNRLCAILGYKREDLLHKNFLELVYAEDQAKSQALSESLLNGIIPSYSMEKRYLRKDGSLIWVNLTASLVRERDGESKYRLAVIEDIAARKAVEAALRDLTATLEKRVKERTAELERSNQELDQFAYVASHDLRAPLRAIVNLAGWIAEDAADQLPAPSQEHLAKLQGRTLRMERLLDDLLTYSRVGRSDGVVEGVKIDLLIQNVLYLLVPPDGFTVTVLGEMPFLLTPRTPLELVFRNLIGNAIKHHHQPATGLVQISAQEQGDFVEFTIHDNGPGIEPQYHERIFGMFQTLRPRDQVEGSGMGLAIVKRAVEYRGGVIQIESTYGAGTTFRFLWPKQALVEAGS